jgi:O-methyltransferase
VEAVNDSELDCTGDISAGFSWELRKQLEFCLKQGCRRAAFVPDNAVARELAAQAAAVAPLASFHFVSTTPAPWSTPDTTPQLETDGIDVVVICVDEGKIPVLSWLNAQKWQHLPQVVIAGAGHQFVVQNRVARIERATASVSYATGYGLVKAHLLDCLRYLRQSRSSGLVVEMGAFRGGTLMLLSEIVISLGFSNVELVGFDTFAGFPTRRRLLDLFAMERFEDRDFQGIQSTLAKRGIGVVRGDIVDTARWLEAKEPILTFFDTDNYTPTAAALPLVFERTIPGGVVVFDHYYTRAEYLDTIGERVAAEEFFRGRSDYFHLSGTGVFVKLPRPTLTLPGACSS